MSRDLDHLLSAPWMHLEKELHRQTESLGHIADISSQRMIREVQATYSRISPQWESLIRSPVFEAMKEIQESTLRNVTDHSVLRINQQLQHQNELWLKMLALPTQTLVAAVEERYRQVISSMSFPALQAISNEALRYFESASASATFPQSFVGHILDQLQNISEIENIQEFENEADSIERLFEERVGRLRPDFISREGMIQVLLAIILFWFQIYQSGEVEDRITNIIRGTETRILEEIAKLKPVESKEVFFMVSGRRVLLRSGPTTKKPVLGVLYPNQRVSLIEAKGKWIFVKYFDYLEGAPKSGWVLKKYLRRSAVIPTSSSVYPLGKKHPLVSSFGAFENEPLWDELVGAMNDYRREVAAEELLKESGK